MQFQSFKKMLTILNKKKGGVEEDTTPVTTSDSFDSPLWVDC